MYMYRQTPAGHLNTVIRGVRLSVFEEIRARILGFLCSVLKIGSFKNPPLSSGQSGIHMTYPIGRFICQTLLLKNNCLRLLSSLVKLVY